MLLYRAVGVEDFSELACDFNDKGKGAFEKQDNSSHLGEDISPCGIKDSGLMEYFDIFLKGAVGTFRSGSEFFNIFIAF